MSKVSALVSAYYAEGWLDRRITNIFGMKSTTVEPVVICQAGSKEDETASDYAVTVVRTLNIPTIGRAWNLGIEQATGNYLTTANTDDRYHIGGLTRMVDALDTHPEIGVVFSQVDVDDYVNIAPWKRIGNPTGEIKNIRDILEHRCIIGAMPVWRKEIHDRVGLFNEDYIVASDYDMWLRMARAGVRFYYIAESLGVYTKRDDSLEHRNRDLCKKESRKVRA